MSSNLRRGNLDARPDRVDFRDRNYQPPLRSLPDQYPPQQLIGEHLRSYVDCGLILDQKSQGACTGFGLAAVINYIYWSRWVLETGRVKLLQAQGEMPKDAKLPQQPAQVSPHMLFRNARLHDEWEGSDYDWSSCRGAMKGWHKHGVCEHAVWPSPMKRPAEHWANDAALRPLGSYYRVNAKSVADMQAAVFEVHAVYCSADVHSGWGRPALKVNVGTESLAVIRPGAKADGGHAFAIVGYTRDGFIVQNSWGPAWGSRGFALLTYEDWIKNGYDAWVAALAAPMSIATETGAGATTMAGGSMSAAFASLDGVRKGGAAKVPPWTSARALDHAVILGNDGALLQRLPQATSPADSVKIVAGDKIKASPCKHVVIYVHGGLNSEEAALNRAARLGPWFYENGVHPIFVVWRTGIFESLQQVAQDEVAQFEAQLKSLRSRGIGDIIDATIDRARDAFDLAFEAAAEKLIGKAAWSKMKDNARAASQPGKGLLTLLRELAATQKPIHLLGHSAGSIMIGHMLAPAAKAGVQFASCGLYAPACTLDLALQTYGPAMAAGGALAKAKLTIDLLTDKAEVDDTVGAYGKSLLYLVSRSLEVRPNTHLLGMQAALSAKGKGLKIEFDPAVHAKLYGAWQSIAASKRVEVIAHGKPMVPTSSTRKIKLAHGSFDNDIDVVNASLQRILGAKPNVPVTDLSGY